MNMKNFANGESRERKRCRLPRGTLHLKYIQINSENVNFVKWSGTLPRYRFDHTRWVTVQGRKTHLLDYRL